MLQKQQCDATLSEHELSEMRSLLEQRSGILFDVSRERFFSLRVREHMRDKKLAHGAELLRLVRSSNVEYDRLLERRLTQETSFNRYPAIFSALERRVLPEMHTKKFWEDPRSLRIWSAGCSSGEEPYTIAITVADAFESTETWNVQVLATDISRQALDIAEQGVYPRRELETLKPHQFTNYFTQQGENAFKVNPKIRNMVKFAPLTL